MPLQPSQSRKGSQIQVPGPSHLPASQGSAHLPESSVLTYLATVGVLLCVCLSLAVPGQAGWRVGVGRTDAGMHGVERLVAPLCLVCDTQAAWGTPNPQ